MSLHQPYNPPFIWVDWSIKLFLLLLTLLWAIALTVLVIDLDDPYSGLEVFLFWVVTFYLSKHGWWLYYELIEERGWLRPVPYLLSYIALLILLFLLGLWHAAIVAALSVPLCVSSHYLQGWVRRRFRLWRGTAYRIFKSYSWVKRYFDAKYQGTKLFWGGVWIPIQEATKNLFCLGMIGSGKTTAIRFLLQSYLPLIGTGKGYRALIYDATGDMGPVIKGINNHCRLHYLNPFLANSTGWNIGADITEDAHCQQLADLMVPAAEAGGGVNEFWRHAAVTTVHGAALNFALTFENELIKDWSLRDLIESTRSVSRLKAIMYSKPELARFRLALEENGKLTFSILVTSQIYLSRMAVVAALNEHAPHKLSIRDWHEHEESILLLGRDPENAMAINALNQLFMIRLSEYLLKRTPRDMDTLICLDEVHTLGRLPADKFSFFITNARKYGVSMLLACQSYASLIQTYGQELAETITGQLMWKAFLRMNDRTSQEFATATLGYGERFQQLVGRGFLGRDAIYETTTVEWAPIIAPSDFLRLAPPDPVTKTGLTGFYTGLFGYWYTMPSKFIGTNLKKPDNSGPALQAMPIEYQHLQPWSYDDIRRLKLDGIISPDDHQVHQAEEEKLMQAVDDVTQGEASINAILKKLDGAYQLEADTNGHSAEPEQDSGL